ncbi:response regulator transcription factor [Pedobacter cryoconitis]|uniref:response regulator transcription factor n=1 Tax=Pedobacter cryoconitis TaxID=188932 RepID=UPI0016198A8A|nr:helix-turn-helix transcriptional regulator [Pedobacter cryoconitis]MBB5645840.1 DNA-binding CsgD family transcriptional regulator [Pedobacter cryoconitis]
MKTNNKPTWLGYLNALKNKGVEAEQLKLTGFDDFFLANDFAQSFFMHSIPFVYLLDYQSGLYINMSENFAGYSAECFLKEGINHTLEIYQQDHLRLFDEEIFPDRLQILEEIAPEDHKNHIFSYQSVIKNRYGQHEHFLQRNCFISDEDRNPVYSMGIMIKINDLGDYSPVLQTVERIDTNREKENEIICKKVYYLNKEDQIFSKREKEVLSWMAEGLSSKMIADKLFVSEHTVINHRRSMQQKSNMPNAIALVGFAIKSGII